MNLKQKEITIREATHADAEQLCTWWNDGAVMAHAGFPNGLGTTKEAIIEKLDAQEIQNTCRHKAFILIAVSKQIVQKLSIESLLHH